MHITASVALDYVSVYHVLQVGGRKEIYIIDVWFHVVVL